MRQLIQPALKIMARTGLFLSVVAWIVSQWWAIGVHAEAGGRGVSVGVLHQGWYLFGSPGVGSRQIYCYANPQVENNVQWFRTAVKVRLSNRISLVAIRHYLIISTFTLTNVALWWYRKPKEVTPCES